MEITSEHIAEMRSIKAKIQEARAQLNRAEKQITDAAQGEISVHIGSMLAAGSAMMAGVDTQDAERLARELSESLQAEYRREVEA